MKRVLSWMLAMLLVFCSIPVTAEERTGVDLSYERAAEMAVYMRDLIMGDYLDIKQSPDSLRSLAEQWAAGITDKPRLVVQLDVESQAHVVETNAFFSQEPEIVAFEAVSTMVIEIWQYLAMYAAEESGVTAASYQEIMQVNGLINAATMYAEEGKDGNGLFVVLYEDAAPILLIVSAENGAVSIRGMFLPSAKLAKCENYGQVSLYLMLNGVGMPCQEVKPE